MIEPKKLTVDDILSKASVLSIPSYQRAFDWGKEELTDMLEDLKSTMRDDSSILYLGNFIFEEKGGEQGVIVVDGQQRLTTISLILIAIRERAKELKDDAFALEVQNRICVSSKVYKTQSPKFRPSESIRDLYNHIVNFYWDSEFPDTINSKSVRKQRNKIKPLYTTIYNEIRNFNIEDLSDFTRAVWSAYVVVLNVSTEEDVFSIFERTNARGLDLNAADLFKNYLFSFEDNSINKDWEAITENSGTTLLKMMKYFWVSENGYIQQSKLYRRIRHHLDYRIKDSVVGISDYVREIRRFSDFYRIFHSLEHQTTDLYQWLTDNDLIVLAENESYLEQMVRSLSALKLFRVSQPIPLIYSIFICVKRLEISKPNQVVKALLALENYHFINNVITGKVANEVERFYASYCVKFSQTEDFNFTLNEFINELRKKLSTKFEFQSAFIDELVYEKNPQKITLINYFFDRYNNYDFDRKEFVKGAQYARIYKPEIPFKKRQYNIEHIFAQNSNIHLTDDQVETINEIGNLIVISLHTNSSLGNKDVKDKIALLKTDKKHSANLRYIDEVIEFFERNDNWDFDVIKQRSLHLAKLSYEYIWSF